MKAVASLPDLWADFNEVYDDDLVWTSIRRTPGINVAGIRKGKWVRLVDADGASCLAIVIKRRGPIATCQLDWSTWQSIKTSPWNIAGIQSVDSWSNLRAG